MNLALAAFGGYPVPTWESEEGAHTPSGSKTPIIICGWLLKMKREHRKFRSTWNRRWFTVEDGAFHWYKTSSSDACGRLSLTDIKSVRRYVGEEHGSFTFVVHATDREMLLRADSPGDESRWIRGLTLQTDLVHGGTFQGPPSAKNRRRTVLKLLAESCDGGGGSGRDGRDADRGKSERQNGCGEWKGAERSQFREINNQIRAIMNDQDGGVTGSDGPGRGGGGGEGGGSVCSAPGANHQTRYYSDRMPAQKFKITPRDPRGISIAWGRGIGKSPAMDGGTSNTGGGDADSRHRIEPGAGDGAGAGRAGPAAKRFPFTTSKVVPILRPSSPRSCCLEDMSLDGGARGGIDHVNDAQDLSSVSTQSTEGSQQNHHNRQGSSTADCRSSGVSGVSGVSGSGTGGGGGAGGRPRPPMPSGPPPANARCDRTAATGNAGAKHGDGPAADGYRGSVGARRKQQNRQSGGGDGGRGDGHPRRAGGHRKRGVGGSRPGARDRCDRHRFTNFDDCSSDESSSCTRGDPFMDDYVCGATPRVPTPSQYPPEVGGSRSKSALISAACASDKSKGVGGKFKEPGPRRRPQRQRPKYHIADFDNDAAHGSGSSSASSSSSFSCDTSATPSPASSPRRSASRQGKSRRNFDDDEFSRDDEAESGRWQGTEGEAMSVDKTNYWPQAGYAGGGSNSRTGSATAEDLSWNAGMMGGSSSRSCESSRTGSRGGSRGGVGGKSPPTTSRPRYLVQQNRFQHQRNW